jgi:hypothetical protein
MLPVQHQTAIHCRHSSKNSAFDSETADASLYSGRQEAEGRFSTRDLSRRDLGEQTSRASDYRGLMGLQGLFPHAH